MGRQLPEVFSAPSVSPRRLGLFSFSIFHPKDMTLVLERCHIQAVLVGFIKGLFVAVEVHTVLLLCHAAHAN